MFKGILPTEQEKSFLLTDQVHKGNSWHINGVEIEGKKILGLGRSAYYIDFLVGLSNKLGTAVYQSDFMTWDKKKGIQANIDYYIDTADQIFFNLYTIDFNVLRTILFCCSNEMNAEDLSDAIQGQMTLKELAYILKSKECFNKTIWLAHSSDSRDQKNAFLENVKDLNMDKFYKSFFRYKTKPRTFSQTQVMSAGYKFYGIESANRARS